MPAVRLYNGRSGAYLADLQDWDGVEVSFTLRGPESGQVTLPVPAITSQKNVIRADSIGAYAQVDARDRGLAEVWFGRVRHVPGSSSSPSGALQLVGPHSWLSRAMAPPTTVRGTAAEAVRRAIEGQPTLEPGAIVWPGPAAEYPLLGQNIISVFDMVEQYGGLVRVRPSVSGAFAYVEIHSPFAPLDYTQSVTLHEGANCEIDFEHDLEPEPAQLWGVGDSLMRPGAAVTVGAKVPVAHVVGIGSALGAVIQTATSQSVATGAMVRPEILTGGLLQAALETALQRGIVLPSAAQVTVTDTALWSGLWPGRLVSVRCTSDPLGDYTRGVGLIEQATFGVTPPYRCNLAVSLWSAE